jgi:hypothetical protein
MSMAYGPTFGDPTSVPAYKLNFEYIQALNAPQNFEYIQALPDLGRCWIGIGSNLVDGFHDWSRSYNGHLYRGILIQRRSGTILVPNSYEQTPSTDAYQPTPRHPHT